MDLFQELMITAFFTLLVYFLVAKLVSVATEEKIVVSEPRESAELKAQRPEVESEARVELVEGAVEEAENISGKMPVVDVEVENVDKISGKRLFDDMVVEKVESVLVKRSRDDLGDEKVEILSGETLAKDVLIEKSCEGEKLDEIYDMDRENEVSTDDGCLSVDDEIVGDIVAENDNFEHSGDIGENMETAGDVIDSRVTLIGNDHEGIEEDLIVGVSVGQDDSHLKSLGGINKNVESIGVEDDILVDLGKQDSVSGENNDVGGVSEVKILELVGAAYDILDSSENSDENAESIGVEGDIRVSDVSILELVGVVDDILDSSGAIDDNAESIAVEGDTIVNLGSNDPVGNCKDEVEKNSEGRNLEEREDKIVEHLGMDNDSSDTSGANVASVEIVGVGGDFALNLGSYDKEEKINVLIDDDDDWEGIERSELEEKFAAAANYVYRGDNDVKMELYGLNKVALEGPCHASQPMALKVSARAKWNAWQKLGNMSPEDAMEQYILLLSDKAPEWMEGKSSGDDSKGLSGVAASSPPGIGAYPENQLNPIKERVPELNSPTDEKI